ncbi:hypothetical protein B0J11DRAFT_500895 [Dendryphion nanum]|uniref:Uncharacterized protein n=1 Tax=Dendryphion nanum TaxID=256645 RepID=A0A9P9J277_9PLEO|nr:hypothetical protein B0J11DRAFT_500895 [Dendryphion nanum]
MSSHPTGSLKTTASASSSTASSTASSTSSSASESGLSTGAAVGIGVGVVLVVAIAVIIGIWVWFKKRQRNQQQWSPPSELEPTSYYGAAPGHSAEDHKRLVGTEPVELAVPNRPVESSAVELAELEGDHDQRAPPYQDMHKHPIEPHGQSGQRAPGQQFEEYVVSPTGTTPGTMFLPASVRDRDGGPVGFEDTRSGTQDSREDRTALLSQGGQHTDYQPYERPGGRHYTDSPG